MTENGKKKRNVLQWCAAAFFLLMAIGESSHKVCALILILLAISAMPVKQISDLWSKIPIKGKWFKPLAIVVVFLFVVCSLPKSTAPEGNDAAASSSASAVSAEESTELLAAASDASSIAQTASSVEASTQESTSSKASSTSSTVSKAKTKKKTATSAAKENKTSTASAEATKTQASAAKAATKAPAQTAAAAATQAPAQVAAVAAAQAPAQAAAAVAATQAPTQTAAAVAAQTPAQTTASAGQYAVNLKNGKIHIVGECSATGDGGNAMKEVQYFATYEEALACSKQFAPNLADTERNCGNCFK